MVDIEKLAIRHKEKKTIGLKRGEEAVDPTLFGSGTHLSDDDIQALSRIIQDLNSRFNTTFTKDEILVIKALERKISEDEALQQQLRNGSQPAVRATFYQVAEEAFEKIIDENYKFYKKVRDDEDMSKEFFDRLFEWFITTHKTSKAVKGKTAKGKKK
jgi:type I restriction enzyme R subunit